MTIVVICLNVLVPEMRAMQGQPAAGLAALSPDLRSRAPVARNPGSRANPCAKQRKQGGLLRTPTVV